MDTGAPPCDPGRRRWLAAGAVGLGLAAAPALAQPGLIRAVTLAGLIAAGSAAYGGLVLALGVTGWRDLRNRFRRQPA
jgi:hypothetical protein